MQTTTKTPRVHTIYQQMKRLVLPHIEHFQDDLLVHDRAWLRKNPGVPFLHWTRSTGTDLCGLFPANSEMFPPAGELRPYLFSFSKREHFLRQSVIVATIRHNERSRQRLVLWFDGCVLREIDTNRGMEIAREYERKTLKEWGSTRCYCGGCYDVKVMS